MRRNLCKFLERQIADAGQLLVFVMAGLAVFVLVGKVYPQEPKVYHTGYKPPANAAAIVAASYAEHGRRLQALPTVTADKWDCRAIPVPGQPGKTFSIVTRVRNQGNCGSCWGNNSTSALESWLILAGHGSAAEFILSLQYTMDCYENGGCNGDWHETVIRHCATTGIPLEKDYYPYEARARQCRFKAGTTRHKIADFGFISKSGIGTPQQHKDALVKYGPIPTAVAADNGFAGFRAGSVMTKTTSTSVNHAVLMIGFDDNKLYLIDAGAPGLTLQGGLKATAAAVLVRNSWGDDWCDGGDIWMGWGVNRLGTESMFGSATKLPPVPPIPPDPIPPGPTPPGTVTITLTPEQVQSVIKQSGGGLTPEQADAVRKMLDAFKLPPGPAPAPAPKTTGFGLSDQFWVDMRQQMSADEYAKLETALKSTTADCCGTVSAGYSAEVRASPEYRQSVDGVYRMMESKYPGVKFR